jgi:hypothetical protein
VLRVLTFIEKDAFLSLLYYLAPGLLIRVNFSFWLLPPVVAGDGDSPDAKGRCLDLDTVGFAGAAFDGFDVCFVEVEVVGRRVWVESYKDNGNYDGPDPATYC